jgi:hypothetical protein
MLAWHERKYQQQSGNRKRRQTSKAAAAKPLSKENGEEENVSMKTISKRRRVLKYIRRLCNSLFEWPKKP